MVKKKVAVFDVRSYERPYYSDHPRFDFEFFETRLDSKTAQLCQGHSAVLGFVNDALDRECLEGLIAQGVGYVGLRCAGFNNVDPEAAKELGLPICRVPGYSPQSVAEFALLQMLCLSRKLHRALRRTQEMNFALDGLVGQSLFHKTVGVVGTGLIGRSLIDLLQGFHCEVLAYDLMPDPELQKREGVHYVDLDTLFIKSDYVSLHVPLVPDTKHLVNQQRIDQMKPGAFLINTGRGGLVDSKALIRGLKTKKLGGAGLDVYEEEEKYFFKDFSDQGIDDDRLARIMSFPNVIVTSHQAYLTRLSLDQIAASSLNSLEDWMAQKPLKNLIY